MRSDRLLVERKLKEIISSVTRIRAIGEARCSVVLEHYEYLSGDDKI